MYVLLVALTERYYTISDFDNHMVFVHPSLSKSKGT